MRGWVREGHVSGEEQGLVSTSLKMPTKSMCESGGQTSQAGPHTSLIWTQNSLTTWPWHSGPVLSTLSGCTHRCT